MSKKGLEEGDYIKYGRGRYYHISKLIGKGGFGKIFSAVNHRNVEVVIKVSLNDKGRETIETENRVYSLVNGITGFPFRYLYGSYNNEPFIAMKRCGCSVGQYFRRKNIFGDVNAARVGLSILSLIEQLHKREYLHRDIKPDNMLINEEERKNGTRGTTNRLYLIDFGNASRYRDYAKFLIKKDAHERCAGTNDYATPNWHRSKTQSCRDDLLSLAFSLSYLCIGCTPWYSDLPRTLRDHEKMAIKKEEITGDRLFPGCSVELVHFYENIKNLNFHDTPDYDQLKQYMTSVAMKKP